MFVDKKGEPLRDQAVLDRIIDAVEKEGADAWFASDPSRFLGPEHDVPDFEQVTDILDVWFDSGVSNRAVLEKRGDLAWPADMYLEGSDQHRGWFQSSLLPAVGGQGYYGHRGHEAVIERGCTVSGCTVHYVDQEYDHGRILVQRTVPVRAQDTPDDLAARIFEQELIAFPEALRLHMQSVSAGQKTGEPA